jgi:Tol biopolymer transport system component/tRNA A-37 threonylcarbamoyl transferase component Bud32
VTPEQWRQVKKLLARALEKAPQERSAYLDQACTEPDLRREVESLIAAHDQRASIWMNDPAGHPEGGSVLKSGSRIAEFEILERIGAGGMGVVYRARDAKLGRDVALKLLPAAFARDAERMSRFGREAKVLASLNQPNIAAIYGLEDSGTANALVMEFVDGSTLAERVRNGPIPIDDALRIAKQICEGLEYAHERGVVHRDLKPANVKVTRGEAVKILDFGLAKAVRGEGSQAGIGDSPTISEMATRSGVLLGTAAYMSPEQAKGKAVDRRADIWAFGCVLYEMLTGITAFRGESVAETLAAAIKEEPDWSLLPAETPATIRALLRRCLQKDARQRLQAIGDARIAIDEALAGEPNAATAAAAGISNWQRARGWTLGLLGVVIACAAAWFLKPSRQSPKPVTRFTITLPAGEQLATARGPCLALSPDGAELAYVATTAGSARPQIYLRAMDSAATNPVPGTEGATSPFFSPDGQWLGFFADGKVKKVPVKGGGVQIVAEAGGYSLGASWSSERTIVFTPYSSALQEVPDTGGTPKVLTRFESGETIHSWPEFLPGSKAILFGVFSTTSTGIAVQRIGSGERRDLIRGQEANMPRYAPSGQLIYAQGENLMAAPFDLERLEIKGGPVPVVENVLQSSDMGAAQYAISENGSLAYISGAARNRGSKMVWVSRNGSEQILGAPARAYNQPRLSPDGRRVVVDVVNSTEDMQVWMYDVSRDTFAPFTFEGVNRHAIWTPDGKRIVFMSNRKGPTQIFWKLADGSGGLEQLTGGANPAGADVLPVPYSWTPDGRLLAFVRLLPTTASEFWLLNIADHTTRRFMTSRAADGAPQISPDGHWLAYASDESGRREIYVQDFPGLGGKWQVSTDGGNEPQWNRNGRELFYREGEKMMAVEVATQGRFVAGKPRELFHGNYMPVGASYVRAQYDVSPDGQRFLMLKSAEQEQSAATQINVVLNWTEELTRLVPSGK